MDVVFNHVSDAAGSNFTHLVPGYYYRYTADGYLYNGSGYKANKYDTKLAAAYNKFK